ncbi:MAG: zinc ribbon domain-containing protein [Deferribacteres bacterium]|nr:zinc ribbon domain-containing protein [Deferribacteres bacterium]
MPIYDYQCKSCGHHEEVLQRMSEPPVAKCPNCGSEMQKQFSSNVGLQFQGSGFYITDYARKNNTAKTE